LTHFFSHKLLGGLFFFFWHSAEIRDFASYRNGLSALSNAHTSTMRAFDAEEFAALVEKAPKM